MQILHWKWDDTTQNTDLTTSDLVWMRKEKIDLDKQGNPYG